MERVIILKNTDTGQALTLPITPASYPMAAGRAVERLDMAQTGQIALPGLKSLFDGQLEFELPARQYPYMTAGAVTDPQYYIDLLTAWSRDAAVCRYIVTGTSVNIPVLLGVMDYGESDGTNDVQCKLPLYEYRVLDDVVVEKLTQNYSRTVEASSQPQTADSYTVVKGDSLWAICRRIYGDGSLAYKLATANGIANPNLIYPGQVLTLPDKDVLSGYEATPAPVSVPKSSGNNTAAAQATLSEAMATLEAGSLSLMSKTAAGKTALQAARAEARANLGLSLGKLASAAVSGK